MLSPLVFPVGTPCAASSLNSPPFIKKAGHGQARLSNLPRLNHFLIPVGAQRHNLGDGLAAVCDLDGFAPGGARHHF